MYNDKLHRKYTIFVLGVNGKNCVDHELIDFCEKKHTFLRLILVYILAKRYQLSVAIHYTCNYYYCMFLYSFKMSLKLK